MHDCGVSLKYSTVASTISGIQTLTLPPNAPQLIAGMAMVLSLVVSAVVRI